MSISSITMIGQFPDGISLHSRNLRWALSEQDHIYIVTPRPFIKKYGLESDDRTTYIDFGMCDNIRQFLGFWKEFPRIIGENGIDSEWILLMEQDMGSPRENQERLRRPAREGESVATSHS